jgi:hypothetical protein
MESGYVLSTYADTALDAFRDERVRYAAGLDDGSGFLAFDGDPEGLLTYGRVYMTDPQPDHPDTWPDWAKRIPPKRANATGNEVFSIVSEGLMEILALDEGAMSKCTGYVRLTDGNYLTETQKWVPPLAVWSGIVFAYRDVRLEELGTVAAAI